MAKKLILLLLLTACTTSYINKERFSSIQVGDTTSQLEARFGAPYDVETLSSGFQRYHYIERVHVRANMDDMIHYYFTIHNGKVVDKLCREDVPGMLQFKVNN